MSPGNGILIVFISGFSYPDLNLGLPDDIQILIKQNFKFKRIYLHERRFHEKCVIYSHCFGI